MGNPKELKAEDFLLRWEHDQESVRFHLTAHTVGWLAIGFTKDESIVNTNLIMARVVDGEAYGEDQYVIKAGQHPKVESLGVISRIFEISGEQKNGLTTISFSLPSESLDRYHFDLSEGNTINVWLAYSVSGDFDHHSRKRILRKIKL